MFDPSVGAHVVTAVWGIRYHMSSQCFILSESKSSVLHLGFLVFWAAVNANNRNGLFGTFCAACRRSVKAQ